MSEEHTIISDRELSKEAEKLAREIFEEVRRNNPGETAEELRDAMMENAHQTADGHQWVIYTHYALKICAHCRTESGEELLEDCGIGDDVTLARIASLVAYGELRARIGAKVEELIQKAGDDEEEADDEAGDD